MLCVLNIGHSTKDPGCVNSHYNVTEFEFNTELARDIESDFKNDNCDLLLVWQENYSTLPEKINGFDPDFVISLHCNAANTQARGCEVFYHRESLESIPLADIAQNNLNSALRNPNRGVKYKDSEDRGGKLLLKVKAPIILCEPFFLDNNQDYENALDNYDFLIQAYVKTINQIVDKTS